MKPERDLAWGDPKIIRQALVETLGFSSHLAYVNLDSMGYTPHFGTEKLIEQLKILTQRQTGWKPKHLFITNGATGGVNAALYAMKDNAEYVTTNDRYFPFYPQMIDIAGLIRINKKEQLDYQQLGMDSENFIILMDSPSNPEGIVYPFDHTDIFDGAYVSSPYNKGKVLPKSWKIMVGSLSKTLGMPGLRLGWICTDDNYLAKRAANWVDATYVGLSKSSMDIAEEVLRNLNFDRFEEKATLYLDSNREEMQKLLDKFGQGEVPVRGMFAIIELGKVEKKALERAGVKYQSGETWGESANFARLSLGQTREITRDAVKAVLK